MEILSWSWWDFLFSFHLIIYFCHSWNKCLLKQFTVHSGLPHPDNKAAITLSPLLCISSSLGFSLPLTINHRLPTVLNKISEAPRPAVSLSSLFCWHQSMISFFSLHFQKAWLNPCNIRYKNTEGLMCKQNRLLTWNPLLIKANKRHILDSSRLCGWWQIVMLTMVIMSPATYIFHSWQFSQTTHAFIFHYETPLCNKLAITEYHTRSNTFLMVRQVYMCSQDARNLLKCTLSGAFYLYCSVFGLRQIEGVKDQISNQPVTFWSLYSSSATWATTALCPLRLVL